jgi:hypothetical protein
MGMTPLGLPMRKPGGQNEQPLLLVLLLAWCVRVRVSSLLIDRSIDRMLLFVA